MAAPPPPLEIIPRDLAGKFRDYINRFGNVANEILRRANIDNPKIFDQMFKNQTTQIFTDAFTVEQEVFSTALNDDQKLRIIEVHIMMLIYVFIFVLFPAENNERLIEVFNTLCRELAKSVHGGLNISIDLSDQFKANKVLTNFVNSSHGEIRTDLYNRLKKIIRPVILEQPIDVEDVLSSVLRGFITVDIIKQIIDSHRPVVIDSKRFQVSSVLLESLQARMKHGIDPTLFTEEFAARRRRFVPINVDFDALLADIDMKDYTFAFSSSVETINKSVIDKISIEALQSDFPEIDSKTV